VEVLRRGTREHFGPLSVRIVIAAEIARSSSGKFRYVISHASGGQTESVGAAQTAPELGDRS
jgi:hypothetical protein